MGFQGLFADMLFVLSEPIPPLVKLKIAIPVGHRKCPDVLKLSPFRAFGRKEHGAKIALGRPVGRLV